jgi:predicted nucleic acid-binding protein
MVVIADSSPLHYLVDIGHTEILPTLFSRVVIPPQVADELTHPHAPQTVRAFMAQTPSWLEIRVPANMENIARLDLGERAAISLACEMRPDFLLIDERLGRQAAIARNLVVIGTLGVLERAANQGLINLANSLNRLQQMRFHVAESLLEETIRRHEQKRDG